MNPYPERSMKTVDVDPDESIAVIDNEDAGLVAEVITVPTTMNDSFE